MAWPPLKYWGPPDYKIVPAGSESDMNDEQMMQDLRARQAAAALRDALKPDVQLAYEDLLEKHKAYQALELQRQANMPAPRDTELAAAGRLNQAMTGPQNMQCAWAVSPPASDQPIDATKAYQTTAYYSAQGDGRPRSFLRRIFRF